MLGDGDAGDELADAVDPLERLSVPRQSRSWAVEVREVVDARRRVVRRVVEPGEVVSCASGDLDAAEKEAGQHPCMQDVEQKHETYSFWVRVLIASVGFSVPVFRKTSWPGRVTAGRMDGKARRFSGE